MGDSIDRAQDREQLDRDLALDAHQRRAEANAQTPSINDICIDCDEPIEPARLRALRGCTSRCAGCARDYEQRMRQGQP